MVFRSLSGAYVLFNVITTVPILCNFANCHFACKKCVLYLLFTIEECLSCLQINEISLNFMIDMTELADMFKISNIDRYCSFK